MSNDRYATSKGYWYSLIAAAPMPERGEAVNVAILVGNGRPIALRFRDGLPRLAGIAAADEINVYQAVLEGANEAIERGATLEAIASVLAPQMFVGEPRALFREPSRELFERIVERYLAPPSQPPKRLSDVALIRRSLSRLDDEIEKAKVKGVLVQRTVRPNNLYEGKLDRHIPFRVPQIARALRSAEGRDVLLDGLVVEEMHDPAALRSAASRIGQAFYAYDRLRPTISSIANREVRTVGVLQPGTPADSPDILAMREFIKDMWSRHATVIDGNLQNVEEELRRQMHWVAGAA